MWAELRERRVLAGQLLLPIWVLWQLVIVLQFDVDLPCEPGRHHETTDDKVCACAYASATVWHWPTTLQSWKLLQPVGYVALRSFKESWFLSFDPNGRVLRVHNRLLQRSVDVPYGPIPKANHASADRTEDRPCSAGLRDVASLVSSRVLLQPVG